MNSGTQRENEVSIRFCGLGGMGVVLSSIILGKAAIYDNKNAIQTQSYGPEQRGTRVKSDLIISESDNISYPTDQKVNILVAFSNDAFQFYKDKVKKSGLYFINSDLIKDIPKPNSYTLIPASSLAEELKNERLINIIMLGAFIKKTNLVSNKAILASISNSVPFRFKKLNLKAYKRGNEFLD